MGKNISLLVVLFLSFVVVSMTFLVVFSSLHHDENVGRPSNRKIGMNGREIPLGAHEGVLVSVKVSGRVGKKLYYNKSVEIKKQVSDATAPGHSPGIGHGVGIPGIGHGVGIQD